LKMVNWNCSRQSAGTRATSRPARHVGRRHTPSARTPRRRNTPRSEAGRRGHCAPKASDTRRSLGWCHAASPHSPAGEPPSSIHRWPLHVANRLRAHAIASVASEGSVKPPCSASVL
jgi:hypothetical protein